MFDDYPPRRTPYAGITGAPTPQFRDASLLRFRDFIHYAMSIAQLIALVSAACPNSKQQSILASLRSTDERTLANWAERFILEHAVFPAIPQLATYRMSQIAVRNWPPPV